MAAPRSAIVGIGDAGCAALDRLVDEGITAPKLIAVNTYEVVLNRTRAPHTVLIGSGLGGGGDPQMGQAAAATDRAALMATVEGYDRVILLAGLGGGTGTGATPVMAGIAAESGANVVAIVSFPFTFEGEARRRIAEDGVATLHTTCQTIVLRCDDLLTVVERPAQTMQKLYGLNAGLLAWQAVSNLFPPA